MSRPSPERSLVCARERLGCFIRKAVRKEHEVVRLKAIIRGLRSELAEAKIVISSAAPPPHRWDAVIERLVDAALGEVIEIPVDEGCSAKKFGNNLRAALALNGRTMMSRWSVRFKSLGSKHVEVIRVGNWERTQ